MKFPYHQQSIFRTFLFRFVLALLISAGSYLIFEFGRIKAGFDSIDANNNKQAYLDKTFMLSNEISKLKQEIAILKTNIEINQESYKFVEARLSPLQTKIQEQREAIAFYRGIVSPSDGNPGLRIQDLRLIPGRKDREFNIRLILIQSMKHDRKVSGNVNFSIVGSQNGNDKTYELSQLISQDKEIPWAFSFQYFQDFDRKIILPINFIPKLINIEVISNTKSISNIKQDFIWSINQN